MTLTLIVLLVLLAYTYVGYPIVLGVLARMKSWSPPRPPQSDADLPTVTACLPVYNGAASLPAKIASLLEQDYPADKLDILVYCDGCTDDSARIVREIAETPAARGRLRVIEESRRLGKPTGLNALVPAATGELMLMNDVRQPLSRNAVRDLAAALSDPSVGCATGNLVLEGPAGSGAYWRYETWLRRQESRFRGVVGMTGPIAMARRRELTPLPLDTILDDVWIPMKLALTGKRVAFVPDAIARDAAFGDEREFRRKVRTLAGNYQIFARMPALLFPFANPIWFETFSHKIMRLVAPWLMLALAGLSVAQLRAGQVSPWVALLALGQGAFYLAAGLGQRGGKLGNLARTFVVLNTAALVGLYRHLTGRQRVTW
jgi:cellulose synthase/poly-beta-1,6-N-acetylglucosamine synthase-like glycosyltransferase